MGITPPVKKPRRAGSAATAYITMNITGDAEMQSHGTAEERLTSLEARFEEGGRHTPAEFARCAKRWMRRWLRSPTSIVGTAKADRAGAKHTVRFNLGYAALLAILGTVLQTASVFAADK